MGSLEEPWTRAELQDQAKRWVLWPPDESTGIERQFFFDEFPNPLGDLQAPQNEQSTVGYPVSLTMPDHIQTQIASAEIALYEARKQGRRWVNLLSSVLDCAVWASHRPECRPKTPGIITY